MLTRTHGVQTEALALVDPVINRLESVVHRLTTAPVVTAVLLGGVYGYINGEREQGVS